MLMKFTSNNEMVVVKCSSIIKISGKCTIRNERVVVKCTSSNEM